MAKAMAIITAISILWATSSAPLLTNSLSPPRGARLPGNELCSIIPLISNLVNFTSCSQKPVLLSLPTKVAPKLKCPEPASLTVRCKWCILETAGWVHCTASCARCVVPSPKVQRSRVAAFRFHPFVVYWLLQLDGEICSLALHHRQTGAEAQGDLTSACTKPL